MTATRKRGRRAALIVGACVAVGLYLYLKPPRQNRLISAIRQGDIETVRQLVAGGYNVNQTGEVTLWGENGMAATPLTQAAGTNQIEIARLLLDHGAAIDLSGESGYTPLHAAAQNGHLEMCEFLIRQGAPVNVWATRPGAGTLEGFMRDSVGYTPLDLVSTEYGGSRAAQIIAVLLDNGAQVTPRTRAMLKYQSDKVRQVFEGR